MHEGLDSTLVMLAGNLLNHGQAGLSEALDGLARAPLSRSAREELRRLGEAVIRRQA